MVDTENLFDAEKLLDAEIGEVLRQTPFSSAVSVDQLPKVRAARVKALEAVVLSGDVDTSLVSVPGPAGAPEVTLRIYRPRAPATRSRRPCFFWIHGGGYIVGTAQSEDARFDAWCPKFDCVGVSVEYRLAPETPYPGPLEDCYAGLRWVRQHSDELGIDPGCLGIGGASAGGGLAAALALLARDRGEIDVAFQCLIYPMIDDRMTTPSSRWNVPIWPPASNAFGWASYLGPLPRGDVPAYAAAARAADLRGLPPAYVMVGTLDGFLDEDIEYAQRLNQAGVPAELHVYPGAPHGFDGIASNTALSRAARGHLEEWLTRQVAR